MEEAKALLKDIVGSIPETAFGVERQMLIGDLVSRQSQEERVIIKRMFEHFLMRMTEISASDIEIGGFGCQGKIWFRIHGTKKPDPDLPTFTFDESNVLIQTILLDRQRQFLYENRNLDFSYTIFQDEKMLRFRADTYFDLDQIALNMRAINTAVRPFKSLELHPNVAKIVNLTHTKEGMILVTGITGSGKSSTLDTILDLNNHAVDAHCVIIAAPIEYVHQSDRCIIRHREVGRDVLSFKEGTVQSLRQDPDIIIIGELRDPDTILTALEVTDSGHKVFSTLHTSSAVESIDRIIGEVPPIEQERVRNRLADIIQCVISQKLVPSLDKKRVLAKEVMVATPSVRAAIKNNNTSEIYQMMSESSEQGMITMEQDLKRLYLSKRISLESAINFANNKRRLQQILSLAPQGD
ncbi:MAG: PilT/PilU family type 4a pilus ATPase [Ignavibacteria bacterium]|nr:PilT/PilU family type 4a pilus ATPase [Ignavibacteria bacterium]MBI3765116.1 PilT/PilU family type 4a pilus ATPase [Ignavibacteriales bacterium]